MQEAVQLAVVVDGQSGRSPQASHRKDALLAIEALGTSAAFAVPTGALLHVGAWLNWPGWLVDGTALPANCPLPKRVTAADDIMIMANVLDHVDPAFLLGQVIKRSRPLVSSRISNAFMSAPTFGEMQEVIKDTINIHNPHFKLKIKYGRDFHEIYLESDILKGRILGFISLICHIFLYRTICSTISNINSKFYIETTYFMDELHARDLHFDNCHLQFGGQVNRLRYSARWAASQNIESDPALWLLVQEDLRALRVSDSNAEIIDRICNLVDTALSEHRQVPRLKRVASELGLSSRVIMRALARNGTSFHAIVDDYRRRRAAQLINDRSLDLAAIAAALGFTDQSNFGRSFRKWFGESPGHLRKSRVQDLSAGL